MEEEIFGTRHLDIIFNPVLKTSDDGLYIFATNKIIQWTDITRMEKFDNTIWSFTRAPLGARVYSHNHNPLWISGRILRKDKPLTSPWLLWNVYLTKDYKYLIDKIVTNSGIDVPLSISDEKMEQYSKIIKSVFLFILFFIIIYIALHIIK